MQCDKCTSPVANNIHNDDAIANFNTGQLPVVTDLTSTTVILNENQKNRKKRSHWKNIINFECVSEFVCVFKVFKVCVKMQVLDSKVKNDIGNKLRKPMYANLPKNEINMNLTKMN